MIFVVRFGGRPVTINGPPERGHDIRTVPSSSVTMLLINTHVLQYGARGMRSLLDAM